MFPLHVFEALGVTSTPQLKWHFCSGISDDAAADRHCAICDLV